jgi:hypothetical protein
MVISYQFALRVLEVALVVVLVVGLYLFLRR